jgi:FkbM family methyltransferase
MTTWHSQAGQDRWVIETLTAQPARLIPGSAAYMGYFIDVGAYDGIEHSNTYALERDFGWTGICIEPDRSAFDQLCANRTAIPSAIAASDSTAMITIQPSGERHEGNTLTWLLERVDAPPVIDYLSIDTEGHELRVLDGMNFARWQVKLITIEHNLYRDGPALKQGIYDHLLAAGFRLAVEDVVAPGYGPYEDWYVNERVLSPHG